MRANLVFRSLWTLGLVLVSVAPAFSQAVSAQQATSIAAKFAQALDIPWGDTTSVSLRENVSQSRLAEWKVSFHDFATVGVDPNRGVVLSAVDYSAVTEHEEAKEPPKLDKASALARASHILSLAGLGRVAELEAPTIALQECSTGVYRFVVYWREQYRGIPFDDNAVGVMLSAADGRFLALSAGLDIPPPESTTVSVSEQAARDAALDFACQLDSSFQPAEIEAELRIVVPNSYWARRGLGEEIAQPGSRVAWVVKLHDAEGHDRTFWIDTAHGRLLGGTQCKSAAVRTKSRSSAAVPTDKAPAARESGQRPRGAAAIAATAVLLALAAGLLLRARRAAAG